MSTSNNNRPRQVSLKKTLLFSIIIILSLLILFEIILRVMGFNSYQLDFSVYPDVPGDITPRQSITWHLKHIGKKFDISINEQGFRNPGRLRPHSYYRILCLGDSSTMGYGVNDDETYPSRLASFLDYYYPQMIDVLNAGTIGYTIDDELSYLIDKGLKLKPDLIILEVFFNDVIEQASRGKVLQRAFRQKSLPYTPLKSLLLKTATFHLWRNFAVQILIRLGKYFPENPFDKVELALNPQKYPEVWKSYLDKLREFIALTKKNNIPLLIIISPDKYQLYEWGYPLYDLINKRDFQEQIIQIAREEEVEYLDLLPLFAQRMHNNKALFITYGLYDEHQSEIGQLIKAEAVMDKIKTLFEQQGIISLSEKFSLATIQKREATAKAQVSRRWTPQDDEIGIALEGNVDVIFEHLRLGTAPQLRFMVEFPWWSTPTLKDVSLELNISVVDAGTTTTIFTRRYPEETQSGTPSNKNYLNLQRWKNKDIGLIISQRWQTAVRERLALPPPRLLISSPTIVNSTRKEVD